MSIGSVLKERRIELGVKQEDLAEQMTVTVQTVSKWERNVTEPKASQVLKLSEVLNISEREICQGEFTTSKMDPLEFVRAVDVLMRSTPTTEMLIGIHKYVSDTEGFINTLKKASGYQGDPKNAESVEMAKMILGFIKSGAAEGSVQELKAMEEAANKVIADS
ncbi:helix-turn-helix domain-containing protein [Vibrio splendidus]|uniref:Transcriptional regulator n=1 Tax=Vibrio splendidus TaxID=29497 RepID=A0A2N7JKK0_VIBSP|nr:helix-turn-helix transcriptional regulator [Vibrio splendidus]PMM41248.1 transcriptional regulator [Vibrio splendidus]